MGTRPWYRRRSCGGSVQLHLLRNRRTLASRSCVFAASRLDIDAVRPDHCVLADLAKILQQKSGDVIRISGDATVFDAVKAMVEANVGAILVTGGDADHIEGIFTERDYLRRIAVEGRTSRDTAVREVMSAPVIVVTPETSVEEAMALMTDRRIRHAPVVEGERLVGMVSIGDLVRNQSREQDFKIQYLTEYISAR
jgi:CBS domain-containing protein